MTKTTQSLTPNPSGASGGSPTGHNHARAFCDSWPPVVDLQARVRFREGSQRSSVVSCNVPPARVKQILATVLLLPQMEGVTAEALRVDVHRPDTFRYQHEYGLALAMAMVSSLTRKSIDEQLLFMGDVDLHGQIARVNAEKIDLLNEQVANFKIETPVTIVCAPDAAVWVNSSSTVVVKPVRTLTDAVAVVWPGQILQPR